LGFRFARLNPVWPGSVSCSRSSNRTGGVTASGSRKRRTLVRRVTPSATSEHNPGVARLVVNPHVLRCFLRWSLTEVPSLCRSYPASSVLRTSPPPHTARPDSRELPVDPYLRSPLGLPVLRLIPYVCMPSPLPRQDRWNGFAHYCSIDFGLPHITVGSAPASQVSRPAQRSLGLQPADLPSRLMRPSTPKAPAALLPPPPLRLLPGGAIQFPGESFFSLWTSAFSRRTVTAMLRQLC
jgi:hypothetical protein